MLTIETPKYALPVGATPAPRFWKVAALVVGYLAFVTAWALV